MTNTDIEIEFNRIKNKVAQKRGLKDWNEVIGFSTASLQRAFTEEAAMLLAKHLWNAATDKCAETAEIDHKVVSGEGGSMKTFFVNEESILKNKIV